MKTILFFAANREAKQIGWAVKNTLRSEEREVVVFNPESETGYLSSRVDLIVIPDTGRFRKLPDFYLNALSQRIPILVLALELRDHAFWPIGTPVHVLEAESVESILSLIERVERLLRGCQSFEKRVDALMRVANAYLGLNQVALASPSQFLLTRKHDSTRKILVHYTAQPLRLVHLHRLFKARNQSAKRLKSAMLIHKSALSRDELSAFDWVSAAHSLSVFTLFSLGQAIAFQQL